MEKLQLLEQKLHEKQNKLKSQGYTQNQIVLATNDDFKKMVETPLKKKNDYMIELNALVIAKTNIQQILLESLLDGAMIKDLTLELPNGMLLDTDTLDMDVTDINNINEE